MGNKKDESALVCLFQPEPLVLYTCLETGRIMWLGMVGGHPHRFPHNIFSSAYRIFTKLGHMIPLWKRKNPIYFGVKGQGHRYYTYNFWQQDRFHMMTLVLYIGSLPNLTTWLPYGGGRTLFILGSKVKVTVTINIIFDNKVVSTW